MSKQFLQIHTIPAVHPSDIFSVAISQSHLFSASGSAAIKIHNTKAGSAIHTDSPAEENPFPLTQTLEKAHLLGCHHICIAAEGYKAASVGFGGEVKLWSLGEDGSWSQSGCITGEQASVFVVCLLTLRRQQSW